MNIPDKVRVHLASIGGKYGMRSVQPQDDLNATAEFAQIPVGSLAKTVVLKSGKAYLMAVIASDKALNLKKLNDLFKREFSICGEGDIRTLLPDGDVGWFPPMAEPFGMRAIVDKSLLQLDELFFTAGVAGHFIRASKTDFARLQRDAWTNFGISINEQHVVSDRKSALKKRVESIDNLPAMPGLATEIIKIRNNPYANASELSAVIEQDPSLSAQLIRYALSPLYGYQGKVKSVEQAIVRVLGMDFVFDIAFGLSLGKTFNNPKEGPLGLKEFWNHATHCASLSQTLCNVIDYNRRPSSGLAYLSGLLHNFGFLLLGHLFPEQFERLNRAVELQPERSIIEIEREEIGVTHTELGLWLMDAWDMPREIIEAVHHHHDPSFQGDYDVYANIVFIANSLLKRHGIGDSDAVSIPEALLQRIGLDNLKLEVALGTVLQDSEGLNYMATRMAA